MKIQHIFALRKRKRLTHQTAYTLAKRVVQPLDMTRLARFFAHKRVCRARQAIVRTPKVAKTYAPKILRGYLPPQRFTSVHAPVADKKRQNLSCPTALNYPNPNLTDFHGDNGKEFVGFENVVRPGGQNRCLERR